MTATKRDCERACKFVPGQDIQMWVHGDNRVFSRDVPHTVVAGTLDAVIRKPDAVSRDPGLFLVTWTYIGSSHASFVLQELPHEVTGDVLRFVT